MKLAQAIEENIVTRIGIMPYNTGSKSAKELAAHLGEHTKCKVRIIKTDGNYKATPGTVLINWGYSQRPANRSLVPAFTDTAQINLNGKGFNLPGRVALATNKRETFITFDREDVPKPESTAMPEQAARWIQDGHNVVARHVLNSHSGRGIVVAGPNGTLYADPKYANTEFFSARLFTKYVKKTHEYRVFVVGGQVVFCYEKKRDLEAQDRQFFVRTHATGWNFAKVENTDVPAGVLVAAVKAVSALGLHFGAVDIGWHSPTKTAVVFEVNTAPGITGGSVPRFADGLLNNLEV